ncbi:MAG: DUF4149 domain-containing protein [Nitrospinae bacterium]|nr:DUF4149 domain-containing protein [Nitrospinota bacterium]
MIHIIRFIHLSSLVVWIGSIVFFSFIAAPGIFKVLPRETAGEVVGEIFPKYWLIGYICSIAALLTLAYMAAYEKMIPVIKISLLVLMTIITFFSGLAVGSKARSIKAEIKAVEEPAKKESLRMEFKSLHLKSVILNIALLILGAIFLFLTAYNIRV